jgi:GTP cyclohydrolase I
MLLKDIYEYLNTLSPFELQEPWDNAGLQVGSFGAKIDSILLSIDIDEELVENAPENSLVITHHPLIFSPLKSINFDQFPASLIQKMVKKSISLISMHTNFDQTHLNRYVAENVLKFNVCDQNGFVTYCEVDESFETLLQIVQNVFELDQSRVIRSTKERIKRVALTTGSGASLLSKIDADCFLTGDIKYHDAMLAKSLNIAMIDIGHYESEKFFALILEPHLKNLGLSVIIATTKNPFSYL